MAVHESQSLFRENRLARSRIFAELLVEQLSGEALSREPSRRSPEAAVLGEESSAMSLTGALAISPQQKVLG